MIQAVRVFTLMACILFECRALHCELLGVIDNFSYTVRVPDFGVFFAMLVPSPSINDHSVHC